MATTFDYERALEQSNQPLNTLASGLLRNSETKSAKMFQLAIEQRRREQQLEDHRRDRSERDSDIGRAETRQDTRDKRLRQQHLEDVDDTRDYESQKLQSTQRFQFGMELLRDDAAAKRSDASTKKYFKGLERSQQNAIIRNINEDQGLAPDNGEDPAAFITRAAKARVDGFQSTAKLHNERKANIKRLHKEADDLIQKSEADLASKVTNHALQSLASSTYLKDAEAAQLKGKGVDAVIASIAKTDPNRARNLRADYEGAKDQAQKAYAGYMAQDLRTKLTDIQAEIRDESSAVTRTESGKNWDNISPFVDKLRGGSTATGSGSGAGAGLRPGVGTVLRNTTQTGPVAPTREGVYDFMQGLPIGEGSAKPPSPEQLGEPQASTTEVPAGGRRVEGAFPFVGRKVREGAAALGSGVGALAGGSRLVGEIQGDLASIPGDVSSSLGPITTDLFGGIQPASETPEWQQTGFPPLDVAQRVAEVGTRMVGGPARLATQAIGGAAKVGMIPFEMAGNAMANFSDSLTGSESEAAPTAAEIARYRASRGLRPSPPPSQSGPQFNPSTWAGNPTAQPRQVMPAQALLPAQDQGPQFNPSGAASSQPFGQSPGARKYGLKDIGANGIQQRFIQDVFGGTPPTQEETAKMRQATVEDGISYPELQRLTAGAAQGDPTAVGIMKQYVQRVRGGRAFSPF